MELQGPPHLAFVAPGEGVAAVAARVQRRLPPTFPPLAGLRPALLGTLEDAAFFVLDGAAGAAAAGPGEASNLYEQVRRRWLQPPLAAQRFHARARARTYPHARALAS